MICSDREVFKWLSKIKTKAIAEPIKSASNSIVNFSQPWTGGIHEVITGQWKVKVNPIALLFCNYWPIIGNYLPCTDVNWIISQSKMFMHSHVMFVTPGE